MFDKTKQLILSTHLKTDPQVLSQTAHLEDTGKFPSIHWCIIKIFYNKNNYINIKQSYILK